MGEPVLSTEQTQRSLWLGDLPPWVDEGFLLGIFAGTNQLVSVKLIRNRSTGASEGYAFLEFRTHEAADTILKTYNGHPMPNTDLVFRLNWAAYGVGKAQPAGEDFSLFVGDLAPDVTDMILQEYFRQFYPSVRSAKVITDAITGRSKGYGFVRFAMETERDRSHSEMNGHFLSNRPIRVSLATARRNMPAMGGPGGMMAMQAPHPSDFDPTNTTLFIGGLSTAVSEDQLRALFGRFGDIIYVKIPAGKGCGFVQFVLRTSAERAMAAMNGSVLGNSAIRISWGRSSSRAANHAAQLATLAGLPAAAAAAAAFPGAFGDPSAQMLAATGGYGRGGPPQFNGDPYASFGPVGGQPGPHDMFVSGGPGPYGMQMQGGMGGGGYIDNGSGGMQMMGGQGPLAPQFTNGMMNNGPPNGLLPPAAAAAAAAGTAGSGPGSEVNGGSGTEAAGAGTISAPSSAAGSDGIATVDTLGESAKGSAGSFPNSSTSGTAHGTAVGTGKKGGGAVPLVGTHLLASLLI
ncbi:hypothetical protein Ndes2526B_g00582 [Nannochloris sp. 'desiccata']|nr:putative Polyadenylate-binding protein RBP45 [Chlorella desiccata (nom. nud.)]